MRFSVYIIRYALTKIFGESKNAYARAVHMEESNMRRILKLVEGGKSHAKLMELTFEVCFGHNLNVVDIVGDYEPESGERRDVFKNCRYESTMRFTKSAIAYHKANAKLYGELSVAFEKADELQGIVERLYCGHNELNHPFCKWFSVSAGDDDEQDELEEPPSDHPCAHMRNTVGVLIASVARLLE